MPEDDRFPLPTNPSRRLRTLRGSAFESTRDYRATRSPMVLAPVALPPIGLDRGLAEGPLAGWPRSSLCSRCRTVVTRGRIKQEHALGIQSEKDGNTGDADQFWARVPAVNDPEMQR